MTSLLKLEIWNADVGGACVLKTCRLSGDISADPMWFNMSEVEEILPTHGCIVWVDDCYPLLFTSSCKLE